jgi:hypothetical protein
VRTKLRCRRLPQCVGCGQRIPRSERDVVLRRVDGTGQVFYHQRCLGGATAMVEGPGDWQMIYRHIDQEVK